MANSKRPAVKKAAKKLEKATTYFGDIHKAEKRFNSSSEREAAGNRIEDAQQTLVNLKADKRSFPGASSSQNKRTAKSANQSREALGMNPIPHYMNNDQFGGK